ncbi:MAG: hypothetical protein IJY93_01325 [Clostridia bacterium]|nr:hypothetical protein [Clostridia bacterium]
MEDNKKDGFSYTYSAKEQEELRRIREKYTNKEEDKFERLRRLDAGVTQKAQVISLIFGVIGVLILGFGMSLIMSELDEVLGIHKDMAIVIGIITGVIGGVIAGFAYPMYNFVLNCEKNRVAPEIMKLTDELMK